MLSRLIQSLFPEGQRKVMVNLVVVIIGVAIDRLGGGLSDKMGTILISAAAIFTGGNVIEHIKEIFSGTKVGKVVDEMLPPQQAMMQEPPPPQFDPSMLNEIINRIHDSERRFADLDNKLTVQAENTRQLVNIINQSRPKGQ